MLNSDSASTQQAPPISVPAAATSTRPATASSAAQAAKPAKASRTIPSLDSRSRSQVPRKAPPIAPTPNTPSSAP